MDLLHSWEVELISHLQKACSQYEGFFNLVSGVADLHTAYFWLFPVWFYLRRETALRIAWVAVIADWVNLILKWVLFGERPYWWVHETQFYGKDEVPSLKQFSNTCETGPGSPSGHAMGSTSVLYVMITALLTIATERRCPPLLYKYLQIGLWSMLVVLEVIVGMSRVYLATHFPHQVVAGGLTGFVVAKIVSKEKWIYSGTLRRYLVSIVFLTSVVMGFHLMLTALGVDLQWTLALAQKWCVRPDWVHMNSSVIASLVRNMGTLFGLGLGLHSPLHVERKDPSAAFKCGCVATSLALLLLLDGWWKVSSKDLVTFFLHSFGKNAVALFIPTAVVPPIVGRLFKGKEDKDL